MSNWYWKDGTTPGDHELRIVEGRYIAFPTPKGYREIHLTEDEYKVFQQNKEKYIAGFFGLSIQQFYEWLETDGRVRCAAIRRNGQRCKQQMFAWRLEDWKSRQGEYCHWHQQ